MLSGVSPIKVGLLGVAFLLVAASGCSTTDSFSSAREIAAWAEHRGFRKTAVLAGRFRLVAFVRKPPIPGDTLAIYIEGDGAPWPTPYRPPRDPTPINPVALRLAAADPVESAVYLGRPCQYLEADALPGCDSAFWTERRFAAEVVAAYDEAISQQKSALGARRIRLFGYSGGGVLATLLAARRDDVEFLVTVAAPLALAEWVAWHEISALRGSLDPSALGENARLPPSVHFVGGNDETVPVPIVERFVRRKGGRMEVIAGFEHECCWVRDWAALIKSVTVQENAR